MFSSLKNKIKEETGTDPVGGTPHQRFLNYNNNNNRIRSRFSSTLSVNSNSELDGSCEKSQYESSMLRSQCNELATKVADLTKRVEELQEEKNRIEKTNEILLETVKVAQGQKDFYCEEQEKIQNLQQHEIEKLKNLLSFRDQEAVDRMATLRQQQQQIESLSAELERVNKFEHIVEDVKDELERSHHAAQLDKNNLVTTLAAVEEENRHLKMQLQIVDKVRLDAIATMNTDEKVQVLVQERKLLEQRLEEAHLQLSDIKSTWSVQNMTLETQVSRLSNQVAEETTEKRKAIKAYDDLNEKMKQLDFEFTKMKEEIRQRDDKIKLLQEEIDELNSSLKECREDNEQQILFERNKFSALETETNALKAHLEAADLRFKEYVTNAEHATNVHKQQVEQLQQQNNDIQNQLEIEKEEKLTALLRNAEISQSEELLKKELRNERDESNELHEKNTKLEADLKNEQKELLDNKQKIEEMRADMERNEEKLKEFEELQMEMNGKNTTIKILNQRLNDLRKTLQKEFKNSNINFDVLNTISENGASKENGTTLPAHLALLKKSSPPTTRALSSPSPSKIATNSNHCNQCGQNTAGSSGLVMDEVSFKYLKHVIVKFLTSKEVESKHLIRVIATLLELSKEEEKLLYDTLSWKMSWFGTRKPEHSNVKS